jgi:hypothetical protein
MLQPKPHAEAPQDAWERAAAHPAPATDRYNGVPLGMEAFIPFLQAKDPA